MASTYNLLDDTLGLYAVSNTGSVIQIAEYNDVPWTVTNGTSEISPIEFVNSSRYSIRIAPSTSSPIVISASCSLGPENSEQYLSFNARIKTEAPVYVQSTISVDGETVPDGFGVSLSGGRYNAVQSNILQLPSYEENITINMQMVITGHSALNVFMTMPNLINDRAFYSNRFVSLARNLMPDFYWEIDSAQSQPTAPFHRLLDVLSSAANETLLKYNEFLPFEASEIARQGIPDGTWSRSTLVSPRYVKNEYVNWLAQFTGNRIIRNIIDGNGNRIFDSAPTERTFVEWQLQTSFYGHNAGTRMSLIHAAQQALAKTRDGEQSTYSVSVTPHYENDPWTILVQTLENETTDALENESSVAVLSALEPSRPLGYRILHNTVAEFYFTLSDSTVGRLDEFDLGPVAGVPTAAPSDVSISSVTSSSVTLAFTPLSASGDDNGGIILNYQYALSTNGTTYSSFAAVYGSDTPQNGQPPVTISGLSSGTQYWVKLKATNESGTGADESVPVTFTTS